MGRFGTYSEDTNPDPNDLAIIKKVAGGSWRTKLSNLASVILPLDGSNLVAGSVDADRLDANAIKHGPFVLADVNNVNQAAIDSGTIAEYKWLRLHLRYTPSESMTVNMRFNGDSANNYSRGVATSNATPTYSHTASAISLATTTVAPNQVWTIDIFNIGNRVKVAHGQGIGGSPGADPSFREFGGTWDNTSARITSVEISASVGNLGDAFLTVLGLVP